MAVRDPAVIGARIAERRQVLELTQQGLADALGVSKSTVANWERGASYPKRKMGKVKKLLGADIDADDPAREAEDPVQVMLREMRKMQELFGDRELGKGRNDDDTRFAI